MPSRRPTRIIALAIALALALATGLCAPAAPAERTIPAIQGRGAASPFVGQPVTTRGVVTLVLDNGYFLQDLAGDGDDASSDGLFVFTGRAPEVAAGQSVQVSGTVAEFNVGADDNPETAAHTVTELVATHHLRVLGSGLAVAPVELHLPLKEGDDLERFEGMLVRLQGPLTVQQNHFLGRFGQLTLASGGRVQQPTNLLRPGAEALALAGRNRARTILLDDGSSRQNPAPTPFVAADQTVRAGDTAEAIVGVIDYGLASASRAGAGMYKIQPLQPVAFARTNPRTPAPGPVGGQVRVASANVLNFFTTLADGRHACPPSLTVHDCRGARSPAEFGRQRGKIVEELVALDADVVGLMEIQNNGATAVQALVDALNARLGAAAWARVSDPDTGTGTDAIKVAMIYKPGRVSPAGPSRSDTSPIHNRPPLAQSFAMAGGERFTVVVSHFKSKGCDGATGADADQGDLQGCWNPRRVQQAQALRRFVARLQADSGSADVLLIGDFNAYAREDPIVELTGHGFVDLIGRDDPAGYSFVFDGAAGRLDHALASDSLAPQVTGAREWHVNADEPALLDYHLASPAPACPRCAAGEATPTPWRASDHDPLVVGLQPQRARRQ